jgi:hypothetical protein
MSSYNSKLAESWNKSQLVAADKSSKSEIQPMIAPVDDANMINALADDTITHHFPLFSNNGVEFRTKIQWFRHWRVQRSTMTARSVLSALPPAPTVADRLKLVRTSNGGAACWLPRSAALSCWRKNRAPAERKEDRCSPSVVEIGRRHLASSTLLFYFFVPLSFLFFIIIRLPFHSVFPSLHKCPAFFMSTAVNSYPSHH